MLNIYFVNISENGSTVYFFKNECEEEFRQARKILVHLEIGTQEMTQSIQHMSAATELNKRHKKYVSIFSDHFHLVWRSLYEYIEKNVIG